MYSEVKRDIRIGDVLTHYGIWHPDRIEYRIPCPIHRGRDANFSVSERDGLWNCFSVCGRGGSVIDLVSALDGIEPKEAVRKLAQDFKIAPVALEVIAARDYRAKAERFAEFKKIETVEETPRTTPLEEGYRGLNHKTIEHWGLAQSADGIYIPLFDARGKTCGYSIRRFD